jgi:hypothetical protein
MALLPRSAAAVAQGREDYATNLAALYGEHQWVLAVREVCGREQPKTRRTLDDAYGQWRERHRELIDDLEARFAAMVKQASRDQQEYSRNYAKYQSEILKQRQEERKEVLAMPPGDRQRLCAEFPAYLRDSRSDIPQRLPEEFAAIYRRGSP